MSAFSSPAFAYERGVNGEIKPQDKGLPWGLGCPLSHSPLAMFFFFAQAVILGYKLGIVQNRFGKNL